MRNRLTRAARRLGALAALMLSLAACTIEGGVPEASTTIPAAVLPQPTSVAVATAVAERNDTWEIGLLDRPANLYPYQPTAAARRLAAPLVELLYPSPILSYGFGYTTTGVLERIPTIENGGAQIRTADVYLDAAGSITTTVTQVITQVEQLVVDFEWNPRLTWSDGTPVTADDSVFAYDLARAAPPSDDAADRLSQTLSYEKVDDHTTRAVLRPDYTGATYFMTYWTPLPRHLLKDVPADQVRQSDFARSPIGYGPYAIAGHDDNELRMARNPHYFGPEPEAALLNVAFLPGADLARANLLNGNLDVVIAERVGADQFALLDEDQRSGAAQVSYVPTPVWEHIDFNLDVALLQDIRVRRAIALATNRQALVDAIYGGRAPVLDSWVLPGQSGAAAPEQVTRYPYNPDEARRLLDEAGYTVKDDSGLRSGSDGITITLQLMTTANNAVRQEVARRFADDMRAIGIGVDVFTLPSEEMFAPGGPLYLRQFELALFGWGAAPDPGGLSLWSCAGVPSESNGFTGENFAGWCFRDADRAIRTAVTTPDQVLRRDAYVQQQQLWTQELPVLPLFQRLGVVMAAPRLKGLKPDTFAPITWNIARWKRASSS